jgi:polyisoprenoid-binding protein YceI
MAAKTTWVIDPSHSEISFKVKHLMISNVKGNFTGFGGQVLTEGDDFSTAQISFTIDPSTIDTNSTDRDAHLRSGDFFDVENHKEISFSNGKLSAKGSDFELSGVLSIRGISHPVSLDVEYGGLMTDPWGNVKAGFSISGKINRKEWGLNWNAALEAGGVLVGEEIRLNCDVQLLKQNA